MEGDPHFYVLYGRHPDRPLDFILNTGEEKFATLAEYNDSMIKHLKDAWDIMNDNQIQMALQNTKHDDALKDMQFAVGDNVWVWRKHAPNKLEYRFDGPHRITAKLADNSYEIEIAERVEEGRTYAAKRKNVSSRHLRLYQPFDDRIEDTAPRWLLEDSKSQEQPKPRPPRLEEGMYCIVPHYCWIDVELEGLPFCLGVVEKIDRDNNNVQIRRYGNDSNDIYGLQKPGWLHIKSKTAKPKCEYRKTRKDKDHYPYTSSFRIEGKMTYDYPIRLDWILYFGFELENDTIPEHILRQLSADPDIPFRDYENE